MEVYWLWLSMLKGVGPVTLRRLVDAFGTPEGVYHASQEALVKVSGIRKNLAERISASRSLEAAKRLQENMLRLNQRLCVYNEPGYPGRLNRDPRLPPLLYYRGTIRESTLNIGIVGSRRCTDYGKQVTAEAAAFLGQRGVTVISGLAKGIDSYAHTACLQVGGYTLAFVAGGPDICYPPEHQGLMEEILLNGAVISPFPPGTRPRRENFPLRNRVISAWVDALLVVEAAERSGALITAKYALQYDCPVYAVPSSIYTAEGKGTNRLLQEGALVYLNPAELMATLRPDFSPPTATVKARPGQAAFKDKKPVTKPGTGMVGKNYTVDEQWIIDQLTKPQMIDDLRAGFPGEPGDFLPTLVQLEIQGPVIITGQWVKMSWGLTP